MDKCREGFTVFCMEHKVTEAPFYWKLWQAAWNARQPGGIWFKKVPLDFEPEFRQPEAPPRRYQRLCDTSLDGILPPPLPSRFLRWRSWCQYLETFWTMPLSFVGRPK